MIKTHQEVGMANNGEDGNRLRCGFLKKRQDVSFLKGSSLPRKSLEFCKNVCNVAFLQEIAFNHLVRAN